MASVPAAPVLQWDAKTPGVSTLTGQKRESHCHIDGYYGSTQYRLHYPFEDDEEPTSWEIDKAQWTFVTVGLPTDIAFDDEDDRASISDDGLPVSCGAGENDSENEESDEGTNLTAAFGKMHMDQQARLPDPEPRYQSADEVWEDLMQEQDFQFKQYFSHCVLNESYLIQTLMNGYDDDFLAASDNTGKNGIALAATEGHLELLQWLHEKGCDINNRNCRGRTPLMAAALWGRVRVVEYLLKIGANATLQDHKGRSALDLALPCRRNTSERKRRMVYYREPPEADSHRRYIVFQLQAITGTIPQSHNLALEHQKSTSGLFLNPATSSQSGVIDYYELVKRYSIPDVRKAIGRLDRGPLFPIISAMSGYSHSEWDVTVLDNRKWTGEVLELARRLHIDVEKSYASHVEKQLVAYYLAKHVLLDDEDKGLSMVRPAKLPIEATIVVSKAAVCHDCKYFIEQIRGLIPMNLTIKCIEVCSINNLRYE